MKSEERIQAVNAAMWRVFALFVAVALTVNLCQALAGKAEFAVWHLPTLAVAWAMGDCGVIASRAASIARLMRLRWRGYSVRRTRTSGC